MATLKSSLIVLIVALVLAYYYSPQLCTSIPSSVRDIFAILSKKLFDVFDSKPKIQSSKKDAIKIFTKAELWEHYRGTEHSKGLYLAFFGKVYDVHKGKQYYAPGGGYHFFSGRDGTRGFVTGDFSEEGLVDTLDGLDSTSYTGFQEWIDFYEKTYKFVGYLVGNFYDEEGRPTAALKAAMDKIEAAKVLQDRMKEDQKMYPLCNSESSAKGSRVWCSKRSGGIERDWVGVPRLYHAPGARSVRCACIRNFGPPSGGDVTSSDRGDLDNPLMKEYPNCDPKSSSCVTS